MKTFKKLSILIVLAMLFVAVVPASAQLGATDISSFTVQNVDTETATVTIHFYAEDGSVITPSVLNQSHPNPFDLLPGESWEVYLPAIPDDQLADGRYSVVIESSARVVTIANLIGQGDIYFNGSYSGFDGGADTFFLPAVVYNFYGWYSLISVQNVGTDVADVTVTITCNDGTVGTLTATDVPVNTAHHFDLETTVPVGFEANPSCNGSAAVTANQPVVAVDNQSAPAGGNTQSYSGVASGDPTVYVPALYNAYYGWNGSVNIRKLGAGATTVTVTYSDGDTASTCDLTDAAPSCLLYMPAVHPSLGYFGATITNSAGLELVVVVNAANGSQAQTYNGVGGGSTAVGIPSTMKAYYGWNTSFTCQNVGTVATSLHVAYDGYAANEYDTDVFNPGESWERYTPNETFLPDNHVGGATVTANAAGAEITCIVNFNNVTQMGSTVGDWSMSYNAFAK
jgi:hypothetical protein